MREILFRGKRKDNGEWIEGIPIKTYDTEIGMNLPLRYKPKNITLMNNDRVLLCCAMDESAYFDTEDYPLIDDETIGQYTGLKDLHGTRIFEGDILKISFRKEFLKAVVKFGYYNHPDKILKSNLGFYFDFVDSKSYRKDVGYWTGKTLGEIEVIGNIHDNPELLKGSAKNE